MSTHIDPVLLQGTAIELVLKQFEGKKPRFGQFPVHPATHSLRVGSDLVKYGFPLPVCIGGDTHDLPEDTGFSLEAIRHYFGDTVALYVYLCSIHPRFNGEHCDESEDDLFARVKAFTKETQDIGPLAIKSVDSMDSVRGAKYCPADWAPKLLKRAERWLALAKPYLTEHYRDLILDFEEVIRREKIRLKHPGLSDSQPHN